MFNVYQYAIKTVRGIIDLWRYLGKLKFGEGGKHNCKLLSLSTLTITYYYTIIVLYQLFKLNTYNKQYDDAILKRRIRCCGCIFPVVSAHVQ